MSQHGLWVVHTNKCGIVQLLGHYAVPYEIYHPINNCPCYLVYFNLSLRMLCIEFVKRRNFRFCC